MKVGEIGTYTVTEKDMSEPGMWEVGDSLAFIPVNVDGDGYTTGVVFRSDGSTVIRVQDPAEPVPAEPAPVEAAPPEPVTAPSTAPAPDNSTGTVPATNGGNTA